MGRKGWMRKRFLPFPLLLPVPPPLVRRGPVSAPNDSTSVAQSLPRYVRFNARMRESLTSTTVTAPRARGGAMRRSQAARPRTC